MANKEWFNRQPAANRRRHDKSMFKLEIGARYQAAFGLWRQSAAV